MLDIGQTATERIYADVQRRLKRNYSEAAQEVQKKFDAFNARFKEADAAHCKLLADGKITRAEYAAWKRGQVFQGKQWQKQLDQITETLYNADTISQKIVNGERLNVFAANANAMAYSLEHGEGLDFGFGYYDSATVANLLKEQPNLLPARTVKRREDVDWYQKIVNNCVTQSIIQGESIRETAKRIAETTGERGQNAAVRNARTAMTAAQNAGRIEAMHEAQRLGIKVKKRWMATLDARTRDAHRDLDGKEREVDEPFESALGDILFPGDPWALPGNVYNCRCTMVYVHPEYPSSIPRRDNVNGEIVGDMTYREWEAGKAWEAERQSLLSGIEKSVGKAATTGRGVEKKVDYSGIVEPSKTQKTIPSTTQAATERTFLTNEQLNHKSVKWLEKETAKMAAEWYKTGKTGISFPPGTDFDKAAAMLASGKSKTELLKDYKSLRKKLKNG